MKFHQAAKTRWLLGGSFEILLVASVTSMHTRLPWTVIGASTSIRISTRNYIFSMTPHLLGAQTWQVKDLPDRPRWGILSYQQPFRFRMNSENGVTVYFQHPLRSILFYIGRSARMLKPTKRLRAVSANSARLFWERPVDITTEKHQSTHIPLRPSTSFSSRSAHPCPCAFRWSFNNSWSARIWPI